MSIPTIPSALAQPSRSFRIAPRLESSYRRMIGSLDLAATADALFVNDAVCYFMSRKGKLLRPVFVLLCCEVAGGDPVEAVDLAAAVELVHCSSIILDDLPCMDNSAQRRGRSSLHVRFGEATAILTSIHLLSRAFQLVAKQSQTVDRDFTSMLSDAISRDGMICGQILDLSAGGNSDEVRALKTAPLFAVAAQFGASAARAAASHVQALVRFASGLSLALQLRDDVLDGQAEPVELHRALELGRSASNDIFATFGRTAAACDLADLIEFAAAREV